jgi:uncharacterized spore protein YtfJ
MTDSVESDAVIDAAGGKIADSLDRVAGRITADDVFGPVIEAGESRILTAAAVERAGGFGFGGGGGSDGGGGGGGGGNASGRPVAVIEVGPAGVKVTPVLDVTRIGIAVVAAVISMWRVRRRSS